MQTNLNLSGPELGSVLWPGGQGPDPEAAYDLVQGGNRGGLQGGQFRDALVQERNCGSI